MVRIELRNMETGEVSTFIGEDALVVLRSGDEVTLAAEGGDESDAKELAGLCRDFLDAQESAACSNEKTMKRGSRGAVAALH